MSVAYWEHGPNNEDPWYFCSDCLPDADYEEIAAGQPDGDPLKEGVAAAVEALKR